MLNVDELEKLKQYVQMKKYVKSLSALNELDIWFPDTPLFSGSSHKYPPTCIKYPLEFSKHIDRMRKDEICDVIGWNYSKLRMLVVVSKITGKIYFLERVSEFKRHCMPMRKISELPFRNGILDSKKFKSKMKLINSFSSIVEIYAPKTGTNGGSLIYES